MWWVEVSGLFLGLAIILIACELFTNGIEWLGRRLRLGDGTVGSILSAVGTCLPETVIPVISILFSGKSPDTIEIGIGAIAGAPFMLSTLAFFITGVSVIAFRKRRKTALRMHIDLKILSRDISFFILVYTIGIMTTFTRIAMVRMIVAVFLILYYIYYIYLTFRNDQHSYREISSLYMAKYLEVNPRMRWIFLQTALGMAGIIFGAEIFIKNIQRTATLAGVSPLVLSMIITPIATELPEKFNSIIWISQRKDTLALGNITGAMVFQSCIPVSIGILATPWQLDSKIHVSALLAIASSAVAYIWINIKKKLTPLPLLLGGCFYLSFLIYLFANGI